jgi:hypothetical protein
MDKLDPLDDLKSRISNAIAQYASNRPQILKAAFENGGQAQIQLVESEHDALQDAYDELIHRELDDNNSKYEGLLAEAIAETKSLNTDIKGLKDIATIIQDITTVVNIVGRLVMITGLIA